MIPAAPSEGDIIHASYRLVRLLGQGGMGAVWEAEHTRLPKRVAIKFLLGGGNQQAELLTRFRREAEIASRLSHDNIVAVHDFNTLEDGTPYLVMEQLVGEDLRARLLRGPLPLREARGIVLQVVSALALAHEARVVHRDLKPENIFLCTASDGSTRVKVLDFGISKLRDAGASLVTREDRLLGTPGYMAPEQALGKNASIDGRTDLFALAAIFYEMLTGESVFSGETLAEVVYKVVHHTPLPLNQKTSGVSAGIATAVQRALSKDPQQRQASVQAFGASLLDHVSQGDPSTPTAEGIDAHSRTVATSTALPSDRPDAAQAQRRARAWGWPVAAAAAALVAFGVAAWQGWSQDLHGLRDPVEGAQPGSDFARRDSSDAQPGSARPHEPASPRSGGGAESSAESGDAPREPPATTRGQSGREQAATQPEARDRTANGKKTDKPPRPPRDALSPVARAALEQARTALSRRDFAEAVRHARASLYEAKSQTAYAIMAEAYCGQHDVGMARAMLRNLKRARARDAIRRCKTLGVEL